MDFGGEPGKTICRFHELSFCFGIRGIHAGSDDPGSVGDGGFHDHRWILPTGDFRRGAIPRAFTAGAGLQFDAIDLLASGDCESGDITDPGGPRTLRIAATR
jgi:hypothetical protein